MWCPLPGRTAWVSCRSSRWLAACSPASTGAGSPTPAGSRFDTLSFFAANLATEKNFARVEALTAFAEQRGHTVGELAIAWLAAQDGVASVIAGATTPEQVRANATAAAWTLTGEDLAAIP